MTWFKVDDSFHSHPKVLATKPAALGLWAIAGSWSSANLTEGFVPDHVLPRLLPDSAKLARALVTAGLWRRTQGGYTFHDWTDFNPTAEQVKKERSANAERQARWREARRNGESNGVTNGQHNGVRNGATNTAPSRPVFTVVDVVSQSADRNARIPDDDDFSQVVIDLIRRKHDGQDITPDQGREIAGRILAGRQAKNPRAYLEAAITEETDPLGRWLDAPLAAPGPRKPKWCGYCDEITRLIGDDEPDRCPACHPLRESA